MLVYNKAEHVAPVIKPTGVKQARRKLTAANKTFLKSIGLKLKKNASNK